MIKRLLYMLGVVDRECYDVWKFQAKFGQLHSVTVTHVTQRKLTERVECMQEELDEFKAAVATQDLAEQADALIDLVYFAKGTANMLGLPWEALWADVHRANMAKEAGVGKRGHMVDCIKPEGWVGPQTSKILLARGYQRSKFQKQGVFFNPPVDETRCLDDKIHQEATWEQVKS